MAVDSAKSRYLAMKVTMRRCSIAPDHTPSGRWVAFLDGSRSIADPWASFFESKTPWGQRSPGFVRDKCALAQDFWKAAGELERGEDDQVRLFDPDAVVPGP